MARKRRLHDGDYGSGGSDEERRSRFSAPAVGEARAGWRGQAREVRRQGRRRAPAAGMCGRGGGRVPAAERRGRCGGRARSVVGDVFFFFAAIGSFSLTADYSRWDR